MALWVKFEPFSNPPRESLHFVKIEKSDFQFSKNPIFEKVGQNFGLKKQTRSVKNLSAF